MPELELEQQVWEKGGLSESREESVTLSPQPRWEKKMDDFPLKKICKITHLFTDFTEQKELQMRIKEQQEKEAKQLEELREQEKKLAEETKRQDREVAAIEEECEAIEKECAVLKVSRGKWESPFACNNFEHYIIVSTNCNA